MVDQAKIRQAVRLLLEGMGEDPQREGLLETPDRVARMYGEILAGMDTDVSQPLSRVFAVDSSFARRLQLQEKMTGQVAEAVMEYLKPRGVMVLLEAEHMCMTMRGVKKPGSRTVTTAVRGIFETDPLLQERFFHMLGD